MNLTMLTPWNKVCGIAEYSKNLVYHLKQKEVSVSVFSNEESTISEDEDFVFRFSWKAKPGEAASNQHISMLDVYTDVLHVQLQSSLYSKTWIEEILGFAKKIGIKTVATYHDKCTWYDFNYSLVDRGIVHNQSIFSAIPGDKTLIPMGVPVNPVRIGSFGLGRSQSDKIQPICDRLGYEFVIANPDDGWLSQQDLVRFIRSCDAIVLWYPEEPMAGSSSAARMALGARRPIFVSDTKWFEDLKGTDGVTHCQDESALEDTLKKFFYSPYLEDNGWDSIAERHLQLYE